MKLGVIVCEVKVALTGGGEDCGPIRRPKRAETPIGSLTDTHQILNLQVDVIKEIGDESLGNVWDLLSWVLTGSNFCCFFLFRDPGSWLLHGELRDDLRFTVVEQLEILFMEVANGSTLGIANHHSD
jgi:hypothetical protein